MKDIKGYEGLYAITSCGKVYSYKRKRFLRPFDNGLGYLKVFLCKDGKKKQYYLHRLVAEAYLENPNNYPQVNHRDENKSNNCVNNLEFCTVEYNANFGTRNERISKKIICLETGEKFNSLTEAAIAINRSAVTLSNHLRGRRKTCAGLHWAY